VILTVTLNPSIDKLYLLEKQTPCTVMRVKEVCNTAGGKGLNVSRVAAQLGENVTAMGFVGGFNGRYFESLITQPEIRKAFTHVDAELRSCVNCWDLSRGESTEYLEPGAPVRREDVAQFLADFERELPSADVVTLSGSLPAGVPADFYETLIGLCRRNGKPVLLDASGNTLKSAVKAGPTFVKPNADEIGQLLGFTPATPVEGQQAVRAIREAGVSVAALSLGAQGVLVACDEGLFQGTPPHIAPRNTVGCGDSMVAGFAVGMARRLSMAEQVRLAVAVATAAALTMATGAYDPHDLETIYPQVVITRL
jgi:tagatose 6-phosphate kinase